MKLFILMWAFIVFNCFLWVIHKNKEWWFKKMDYIQARIKWYPDCTFCWGVHLGMLIVLVNGLLIYLASK